MSTQIGARRCSISLLVAWASIFPGASPTLAEEKAAASIEGPLLIAQLPEKPDTKKCDLRYKLKRGDVLRYDVSHRASIRSTIEQTTQAAQTKTDSVKVWKVSDVLPAGDIEFVNVVERVHMMNQLPDRHATEYDSVTDKTPPPGFEDAARAVGVPLSVVQMTPRGKILRRDVKARQQIAEDDAPIALRLPEEPVAIGETWDEPFTVRVRLQNDGSKTIETRRHHRLTEVKNGIATIAVTYQVLSPIDAPTETQIVQRLMDGEVRFDIEKGRIVGQQMDIDKRIIGFAGPTSSMQYIMRMEEKLLTDEPKVVSKPKTNTTANGGKPKTNTTVKNAKPKVNTTASKNRTASKTAKTAPKTSKSPKQTASRPATNRPTTRTYRR